jgi:hypothetical protein
MYALSISNITTLSALDRSTLLESSLPSRDSYMFCLPRKTENIIKIRQTMKEKPANRLFLRYSRSIVCRDREFFRRSSFFLRALSLLGNITFTNLRMSCL